MHMLSRTMRSRATAALAASFAASIFLLAPHAPAQAAEVRVLAVGALPGAFKELVPQFEQRVRPQADRVSTERRLC